ncbi:hypothetical protein DFH07DRAFT_786873 [Mycena maculata]|uniref:Uncharacterized protein n=1 Tax=Mycena maculata TaxID=230809 RepID=A0AAD7KGL3_9AGAR|nr:hypothetical protein DFH07DRAFT_786873 [Mycena maculata]
MAYYGRRATPGDQSSSNYSPPPSYSALPPRTTRHYCSGFNATGGCTIERHSPGLCSTHQEQGVWLHPAVSRITAAERKAHAEARLCCGLTKMYALCRNRTAGTFLFCWRHGQQRVPATVGAAPGPEPPQRAIIRERAREFQRIRDESRAQDQRARDRWAQEEQERREQARERAEREQEERRQRQQQREAEDEERRQQHQERERSERAEQERAWQEQHRRSYQRQWRDRTRRDRERAQGAGEEQRHREQQERAQENERARGGAAGRAGEEPADVRTRGTLLQNHLTASAKFDNTLFSPNNRNTFSRIPWPIFPRPDGTIRMRTFKTAREIDVILKNTVRRFHPDRFSANRFVVSSIQDPWERSAALEAAKVVSQTVNACRENV